jgi:O-antigen/teichoic acid export membrane protein
LLSTTEQIRHRLRLVAVTAVFNIAVSSLLIMQFDAAGAAIATVLTEAFLLAGYLAISARTLPDLQTLDLLTPAALLAPAVLVAIAIAAGNEWIVIAAGLSWSCAVAAFVFLTRYFGPSNPFELLRGLAPYESVQQEGESPAIV